MQLLDDALVAATEDDHQLAYADGAVAVTGPWLRPRRIRDLHPVQLALLHLNFFFEFFLDLNCLFVTRGLWAHGPSWEREKFPARFVFRSHCALKLIFSFFLARRLSLYDFFSDFSLRALLGARDSGGALASTLQRSHATRPHFDSLRILRFFLNFLRFFLLLCVRPAACLIEFYLAAGKKIRKI